MDDVTALDARAEATRRRSPRLKVTYRPLATIAPYDKNARSHPVAQIKAIKRSLAEYGWTAPMLIADNQLIAGHARHASASEIVAEGGAILGESNPSIAPTIDLSHLSPEKRRAYVITDNRLAELAGWDMGLLRSELIEIGEAGMDTTVTGYSDSELAAIIDGWTVDFAKVDATKGEVTDQLGLILVRCRRDQLIAVEAALRAAVVEIENVTIRANN
jgi:hypothetical protein